MGKFRYRLIKKKVKMGKFSYRLRKEGKKMRKWCECYFLLRTTTVMNLETV